MFEFCQNPKLLTGKYAVYKIGYVIVNLVISHCADNNIKMMLSSRTAINNKIKPFLCHFVENKRFQVFFGRIFIGRNNSGVVAT